MHIFGKLELFLTQVVGRLGDNLKVHATEVYYSRATTPFLPDNAIHTYITCLYDWLKTTLINGCMKE